MKHKWRRRIHIGYWESQKESDQQDQDINGWLILKQILREKGWDGTDWIDLAQDRDQWRAIVNTVMNLQAP
jgi:hypothetical protein